MSTSGVERRARLGLGTWQVEGEACRRAVASALEIGYRHIDTAQGYGNEAEIGLALEDSGLPREDVFVTTKVWPDDLVEDLAVVDASLERLRTDAVDLLLLHWPSPRISVEATVDALAETLASGKTRAIGVSNFPAAALRRAVRRAPIACNQIEYHPYLDQQSLVRACHELGVAVTAYCPLARNAVARDSVLCEIATDHGATPQQVTLAWLLQHGRVSAVPRARSADHQRQNLAAPSIRLSSSELERITSLACGRRLIDPDFAPTWDPTTE